MASTVAAGLVTMAVLVATESQLAMVWDEGYTLGREARLRKWFRALRDPGAFSASWQPPALELVQQEGAPPPRRDQIDSRAKLLFDPAVLAYFWPYAREEPHGHPPFYALLGLVGDLVAPSWADLPRARLGPILLFSLTASVVWWFLGSRWGIGASIAGTGAWVFQPNLFGHSHYATYDAVLTSLWVLAIVAFGQAVSDAPVNPQTPASEREGPLRALAIIGFALAAGAALATKLTGWFLPLPFLMWTAWSRDRRALRALMIGLPLALLVCLILIPPWWTEPISGLLRFFRSNLTRGRTRPIPVQFLGIIYQTPNESLPWYNTLVWTALVTPVGLLLLAVGGITRAVLRRKQERLGLLILGHWVLLIALRALPHTPGHDGVRLFLPAFGMLALLAGLGARELLDLVLAARDLAARSPLAGLGARELLDWIAPWAWAIIVAAVAEAIVSIVLLMPVPLSYFSPIVGGLPGAARLGMEPTYYWDALGAEARSWLRSHTGPGQTIEFATFPTSWFYLRQIGELPRVHSPFDRGQPVWYVVQNRPGAWLVPDRLLVEGSTPAFQVTKFGIPLVWVFPYAEVLTTLTRPAPRGAE
jgi:4-amino-4-deoxy-L-arabinose transferase-like glycosyltransferase